VGVQRGLVGLAVLITIVLAASGDAHAYTYTYTNETDYLIKVAAQLYEDTDKTGELQAKDSYTISSKALLKSWTAEVFLDDKWQQVLTMTCDLLPGNHTFTIYMDEKKEPDGAVTRTWNALIK
jgi:hypothetical protein